MGVMARLISWWHGKRIGEVRYVKASPFIVGNMMHCLPEELWTEGQHNQLRYCCHRYKWNGFGWVSDGYVEFNRDELKQALLEQENGRT